jgi:hypothetical protein
MTKKMSNEEAIEYMIAEIEDIERERLAKHLEVNQNKKEPVEKIKKLLEGIELIHEN